MHHHYMQLIYSSQVHSMIILVIRKINNGLFLKSEQYQVWKLVFPDSVVLNRLRKVQVGRLPEPHDI